MKRVSTDSCRGPGRSWASLLVWLALCCSTPPVSSAAVAEPVLAVASFGQSGADGTGAAVSFGPADFGFRGSTGGLNAGRRISGPVTVAAGDTWRTVLARSQVAPEAWTRQFAEERKLSAASSQKIEWPQRPAPAAKVWIEWRSDADPQAVYLARSPEQMLRARTVNGSLQIDAANRADSAVRSQPASASLYRRADQVGVPENVIDQMVAIFSGEVDFHRDLDAGFKGTVLYQLDGADDQPVHAGRLLAVHLTAAGHDLSAYAFDAGNQPLGDESHGRPEAQFGQPIRLQSSSHAQYYSAQGVSLERSFLQSPIVFSRVTSGFSVARFHPILQRWRAHTGIDFAAPLGTPVRATASGKIEFVGVRGAYGNLVVLRHDGGRSTYYGHLQGFARGVAEGRLLRQGDAIGSVGMTGMTTGPHLHYEMRQGSEPFDPALYRDTTRDATGATAVRLNPS